MLMVLMMISSTSIPAPFTNNAGDDYGNTDVDIDGDDNMDDNDDESHLHHHPLYYKASHRLLPRSQGPRCTLATGRSENDSKLKILSSQYDDHQHQLIMKEKEH